MKDWCIKHPIMTFLIAYGAIDGIVNIVRAVTFAVTGIKNDDETTITEEMSEEE